MPIFNCKNMVSLLLVAVEQPNQTLSELVFLKFFAPLHSSGCCNLLLRALFDKLLFEFSETRALFLMIVP